MPNISQLPEESQSEDELNRSLDDLNLDEELIESIDSFTTPRSTRRHTGTSKSDVHSRQSSFGRANPAPELLASAPIARRTASSSQTQPSSGISRPTTRSKVSSQLQITTPCSRADSQPIEQVPANPAFKGFPLLSEAFNRSAWDANRVSESTCIGCSKTFKTNDRRRLLAHGSKCCRLDSRVRDGLAKKLTDYQSIEPATEDNMKCVLLASLIVKENLPIRIVESEVFQKFVHKLDPNWKTPSRVEVSRTYIPFLAEQVDRAFRQEVRADKVNLPCMTLRMR